jgi:hypothetical protein
MDLGRNVQVNVPIINNTGGKVDDATARRWAVDVQRSEAWENWALDANEEFFFEQPNLAESESVSVRVFDYDIGEIQGARVQNARVEVQNLRLESLTLIVVPQGIRQLLDNSGQKGYEYGWVGTSVGPGATLWRYSDGRPPLTRHALPAGATQTGLVTGRQYSDPLMGEIWQAGSVLDCTDAKVRALGGCT